MNCTAKTIFNILIIIFLTAVCHAEITFDKDQNVIQVAGYPETQPATLKMLLDADQKNGWKKVSYDADSRTYRIDADLWIGGISELGTFLKMGNPEIPELTVIMNGSIWVKPPRKSAKRSDGKFSVMNGLIIGDPDNDKIKVTLKFDCSKNGEHAFVAGERSKANGRIQRGCVRIYNSEITALTQDGTHNWSGRYKNLTFGWYVSETDIRNSTFSWYENTPFYGVETGIFKNPAKQKISEIIPNPLIQFKDCRFANGGRGFINGTQYVAGCEFSNLKCAIRDGGSLSAMIVNSKFKGNRLNYTLGSLFSQGIIFRDCEIGKSAKPDQVKRNRIKPAVLTKRGIPVFPACLVQNVLKVKVVDASGKPVSGAMVQAGCTEHPGMAVQGIAMTGKDGMTPSDPEGGLLITVSKTAATEKPGKISKESFKYLIKASAANQTVSETFDSAAGTSGPLLIKLKKDK